MKWIHDATHSLLMAGAATLALAAMPASAAVVLIENGSFESTVLADGQAAPNTNSNIPGWRGGLGGAVTYLVDNNVSQNQWFNATVPDGQQAMSLASGYIGQVLKYDDGNNVMSSTTSALQFTVTFYVGDRKEGSAGGTYRVGFQDTSSATASGGAEYSTPVMANLDTNSLANGMWSGQQTVNLTIPAQATSNFIYFYFSKTGGNEMAIDNVSVSLVPEPSVALLGGLGVLAMLRRRRN